MISIRVQEADFDPGDELDRLGRLSTAVGAVACFIGRVRQAPDGPCTAMTLEHYPAMSERQLHAIAAEAERRWPILGGVVIHRHGRLLAGEQIVLVAIASGHRQAAFEATGFLMDWLKARAPFWKREEGGGESRWVEARAEDEAAAARWED